MPIKPKPHVISCSKCNWWVGNAPEGDKIAPWENFQKCPNCQSKDLKKTAIHPSFIIILRWLGKMYGINKI